MSHVATLAALFICLSTGNPDCKDKNPKEKKAMAEENNTAKAGAEPANTEAKDNTAMAGAEPAKDAKSDSSTEEKPTPFDKDPRWKSARTAEKKLNDLLKANGMEDPDDLVDLIEHGKAVKGKLKDLNDLDSIIKDAEEIRRYRPYWQEQQERKRREQEDPEQTMARLEKELRAREKAERAREEARRQADSAKAAIGNYERDVTGLVRDLDIPKEQRDFVHKLLGVGNPTNDIDITDRKAVKKVVTDLLKEKEAYDQAVINHYLKGKGEVPKVSSSSAAATQETKPKTMLKDARKIFLETMQKAASGG